LKAPVVFICYMRDDAAVANSIYDFLAEAGADPWLDTRKLVLGDDWQLCIKQAVERCDAFVVCLRPGFNEIGFRQREVRWALEALRSRPRGAGFIIPFIVQPCELPSWCTGFHAGDYRERSSELEDLLPAINRHCSADLRPRRQEMRALVQEILREPGMGWKSYRKTMVLLMRPGRDVSYGDLERACVAWPQTHERFLRAWQSLVDGGIMETSGPDLSPSCRLTPLAKDVVDELTRHMGD